jgi:hypothetical protein
MTHRSIFSICLCALVLLPLGAGNGPVVPRAYLPLVLKLWEPPTSTSRYMETLTQSTLIDQGCRQGQSMPVGDRTIVVLDFGSTSSQYGLYGAYMYGGLGFHSTSDIMVAVENYISGYASCNKDNTNLIIVIGTNNNVPAYMTAGHAQAWANLVTAVNDWLSLQNLITQVSARGGMDIEPAWASAAISRSWVQTYDNTVGLSISSFYDFGSCDYCPYSPSGNVNFLNDWHIEDVWFVAWGTQNFSIPDIYNDYNAHQWYSVSRYGYDYHNQSHITFDGTMTEWSACQTNDNCAGIDFMPLEGWHHLFDLVNLDPATKQNYGISTDITWIQ